MGSLIGSLIIGGLAGFFAEKLMKSSMGLLGNIALGVAGAFIGRWLLGLLGVYTSGLIGSLIGATAGACLLIFLARLLRKNS